MKRLGKVSHISKQGELIVRGDAKDYSGSLKEVPRIHSFVLDKTIKRIGKISGVFGPLGHPYFIVRPDKGSMVQDLNKLINERVYVQ